MLADKLPLAAGAALVLSLVLIDGVSEPRLCKMAWIALTNRQTTRLLDGLACEVELECGRKQLSLPLPPTVLLLHEYLATGSGEDFEQACVALMTWLKRVAPRIVWPDGPEQVLAVLCGLGKQLKLFEMAPWLASAENIELGAASISLSALVRIVTKRPRFLDGERFTLSGLVDREDSLKQLDRVVMQLRLPLNDLLKNQDEPDGGAKVADPGLQSV